MTLVLDFLLPPPPDTWSQTSSSVVHKPISGKSAAPRIIEPVGPHFHAYARRKRHNRTFSEDERHLAEEKASRVEMEEEVELEEEPEYYSQLQRDPKDWKTQDHYAILGLTKLRYKATEAQIKIAHRRKVLKHHPDKKAATGGLNDDAFFKCIQRAFDTLMDPVKRRQYDSVDFGMADEDTNVPSAKASGDFFKLWRPVFEREARFSNKQPVPQLGDINTPHNEVEEFYAFWHNFDSWRSFEWLDKEDVDGDNRDNKRFQEKKNRAERAKLKKEDNARLIKLVDTALSVDPRIRKFKEEDKLRRNAKKNEKERAEKAAAEEAARKAEEDRLAKEKADADAKAMAENAKKDKEAAKRVIKKEKKTIKSVIKDNNFALPPGSPEASAAQVEAQLNKLDSLLEKVKPLEELEALRKKLEAAKAAGNLGEVFEGEVKARA
ncbi:DnaJ domain-containing protein [Jimgerdemannia flammicorona]|uniref:DnaJ domain-containing protein n=2 Tax=Jimgerdemannia flammicorona TaxID=994334 RepID=A0A433DDS4_9FUNG|nr:DnaJ domain-containing protein [Jimgerdemannia flammicorona]RUS31962.1 DnaJ domain-containing protein [Jimgerdemannia flammicorona]